MREPTYGEQAKAFFWTVLIAYGPLTAFWIWSVRWMAGQKNCTRCGYIEDLQVPTPPKSSPDDPSGLIMGALFLGLICLALGTWIYNRVFPYVCRMAIYLADKAAIRRKQAEQAAATAAREAREAQERRAYLAQREKEEKEGKIRLAEWEAGRAEQRKWADVPLLPLTDPAAADVFATFANATPEQRKIILASYDARLNNAHPSQKKETNYAPLPPLPSLAPQARVLYLPHVIGAEHGIGRYDRLDLEASNPAAQRFVYVGEGGMPNLSNWQRQIPSINRYLGGRWRIEGGNGSSVILTGMPTIPEAFTLPPAMLTKEAFFLGADLATGMPFTVPIKRMTHALVQGTTGVGKSTFMHQLMASVMFNIDAFDQIYMVDLKFGLEAGRYAQLSPKIKLIDDVAQIPDMLTQLEAKMRERATDMKARGSVLWEGGRILVVVDECADLFKAKEKRKAGDTSPSTEDRFASLAQKARAMGILLWMQAHEATNDGVPLVVRRHLRTLIGFKQSTAQAVALMGQVAENTPIPFPELNPGQVIYQDGNDGTQRFAIQGAFVTFEDVQALMQRGLSSGKILPPAIPSTKAKTSA